MVGQPLAELVQLCKVTGELAFLQGRAAALEQPRSSPGSSGRLLKQELDGCQSDWSPVLGLKTFEENRLQDTWQCYAVLQDSWQCYTWLVFWLDLACLLLHHHPILGPAPDTKTSDCFHCFRAFYFFSFSSKYYWLIQASTCCYTVIMRPKALSTLLLVKVLVPSSLKPPLPSNAYTCPQTFQSFLYPKLFEYLILLSSSHSFCFDLSCSGTLLCHKL